VFADFRVVLDACVLANQAVTDVFLRFAQEPRIFLPRWSEAILEETRRAHLLLAWEERLVASFDAKLREHFPEALVTGYEWLLDRCENDPGDRHVLACAIQAQAEVITTFNLRHFPAEALRPWNIVAMHPQDQLLSLYGLEQQLALYKLTRIASRKQMDLKDYLIDLGRFVPAFSGHILEEIG
jgi:predicted nucleic acid-binding protein